jgi:hypothetical protein
MDWIKALVFALITLRQSSKGSSVHNTEPSTSVVDISASGDPPTLPEIHTCPIFTPGPDNDSDHSPTPEDEEERDPLDAKLPYRVATPEEQL